jgi:UMF1 family MFS transporter
MSQNEKRTIRHWTFYDWANSAYPLVIVTAIFPQYYNAIAGDEVNFLGVTWPAQSLYTYAYSAAYLIIALSLPILTGIADAGGYRKQFFRTFTALGAVACASLYFFSKDNFSVGIIGCMVAAIGYTGSLVFYNSYLPEISSLERRDRVSARGFAMGYLGSALLLLIILTVHMKRDALGIQNFPVFQWAFVGVGVWWLCFGQWAISGLPRRNATKKTSLRKMAKNGIQEFRAVYSQLRELVDVKRFLRAYFVFGMAIHTLMIVSVAYAAKEILFESEEAKRSSLIVSILLIQFVGIAGAFIFARLSKFIGNVSSLQIGLILYTLVCVLGYFVHTPNEFYILATMVGLGMGGIQSLARSTYSKLIPQGKDSASFFSFYEFAEKIGIVCGTLVFGLINQWTGSLRLALLSLSLFFIAGVFLLLPMRRVAMLKPKLSESKSKIIK